jgi:YfiH family protein
LLREVAPHAVRLASAKQVHGTRILEHGEGWDGWQRAEGADGHLAVARGTALAVTIADCVPVFLAHPDGAVALLHSGWRGTAAGILRRALARVAVLGRPAAEWHVHLGPAICGRCYEVSPDVFEQLTGWQTLRHRHVDLRALLAEQAKEAGVQVVSASPWCTRCDNDRFFSHRAGDAGRQVGVIVAPV